MTQPTTTHRGDIHQTFAVRLRRLRRKIAAWLLVDGLSRVLLCVVFLIGLDLAVDWVFHLDRAQRIVMLVLAAGAVGVVFHRRVIRPLSHRLTDDALCLEIENHNEQLRQSLISAVQFARMDDFRSRGASPAMVRATIDRARQQTADVSFEKILRADRFRANLVLLIASLMILAGVAFSAMANDSMSIWFDRNVLLGGRKWPRDVHLVVRGAEDGRLTIPRGDDWPLQVDVREDSRRLPEAVYLDFRGPGGQRSEPMEKTDRRHYRTTWRNVAEPFEFRARCSRATTGWIAVELVDRPEVEQLHLTATLPKYAGGRTESLPPGQRPYYVLQGSTLQLRGVANKRLSGATLVLGDVRHEMTLHDGREFHRSLPITEASAGVYGIELTDTERLMLPDAVRPSPLQSRSPATFALKIKPDREPQVLAKLIGVGPLVVPGARVPLDCQIRDDYAVAAARLRHQWQSESSDARDDGVMVLDPWIQSPDRTSVTLQPVLELPPLQIPAGSRLSLFVEADDNDDVSGPKSGKSATFVLRVVSEDELRTDLLRREKEHRIALEGYVKQQEGVLTECESMAARIRGEASLDPEQRQLIVTLQKHQKLLGTNTAALAERFDAIIAEVRNNRLEESDGPLLRRLRRRIVGPMRSLADDAIPRAAAHLDRAWRNSADAAPRDRALDEAVTAQRAVLTAMREILSHLVKAEGFQEAVNLLYEIQRAQQDVLDLTDAEKQKRIRQILDQGGDLPRGGRRGRNQVE